MNSIQPRYSAVIITSLGFFLCVSSSGVGKCPKLEYMPKFNISLKTPVNVELLGELGYLQIKHIFGKEDNFIAIGFFGNPSSGSVQKRVRERARREKTLTYIFTGSWFEIERSFYLMEIISSCVGVDLLKNARGHLQVSVNSKSTWTGGLSISEGIATQTKKDPSVFLYKVGSDLPKVVNRYLPGAGFYQVLETDYNNYAILYSCTNYGLVHTDLIWIWGRKREIGADMRSKIYDALAAKHLDSERLILPKNENCTD